MTPLLKKFLRMNWLLIVLMLSLTAFGIVVIYSCTHMRPEAAYHEMWHKQLFWALLGVIAFLIVSLINYRWVRWGAVPIYFFSLMLLVATLAMGVSGGLKAETARWLKLGPISFQPAPLAVLALIMVLALFLTQFRRIHPWVKLFACGLIAGAPALLILKQPDLGECLITMAVVFGMLFISKIPFRYLIVCTLLLLSAMPIAFFFKFKPYQQDRIYAWWDPEVDPSGINWAVNQTIIAVGSGGWSGKGFLAPDTQVERGNIPRTTVPNDYIFAPIGEQWGFLGSAALIVAFSLLFGTCMMIAMRAGDPFGAMLAAGITVFIFAHTAQNIGMCLRLLPVTGVLLPLVSYSGTFLCVIMFSLGLVNSIWVHRKTP